jgi:hypothetical protein
MEYFDSYTVSSHSSFVTIAKRVGIQVEIILLLDNKFSCENIEAFEIFINLLTQLYSITEKQYTNLYLSKESY